MKKYTYQEVIWVGQEPLNIVYHVNAAVIVIGLEWYLDLALIER
jgi:hypothetical protein